MRRFSMVVLLTLLACSGQPSSEAAPQTRATSPEGPTAPIAAAAIPAAPATQQAPALPAPGVEASAPTPSTAMPDPHEVVDPNAAGLAEVRETGEAIEAALNAAAAAGGDTTCERAYNNLVAMVRELRSRVGTSGQRNPPDHDPFVEACRDLPPEVQDCLVLSYALAHRAECEERKNSLDPAIRVRIRQLMSGEP